MLVVHWSRWVLCKYDNTLDITEIPCSPVTPRTIEATNKDLRRSAIMLEDKIQTMFGKRESDDSVPERKNDSMKSNNEENRERNMILKTIGTITHGLF